MAKKIRCKRGQSSGQPSAKKHEWIFSLLSTFNSCEWNEFIYINLHFVDLGERKQIHFFISTFLIFFFLVRLRLLFHCWQFCFLLDYCYLIYLRVFEIAKKILKWILKRLCKWNEMLVARRIGLPQNRDTSENLKPNYYRGQACLKIQRM